MGSLHRVTGYTLVVAVTCCFGAWSFNAVLSNRPSVTIVSEGSGVVLIVRDHARVVVIGGGSDTGIIRIVAPYVPWYLHHIDALILPDIAAAHTGGAIDLLDRYTPSLVAGASGVRSGAEWISFQTRLRSIDTRYIPLRRGGVIHDGVFTIEPLLPDRRMDHVDTHSGCAPLRIQKDALRILFVCDMNPSMAPYLIMLEGADLNADVVIMPDSLFRSLAARLLLGYIQPQKVIVTHACATPLDEDVYGVIQALGAYVIDSCNTTPTM